MKIKFSFSRKFCNDKKEKSAAEANKCVDNKGNIHEVGKQA